MTRAGQNVPELVWDLGAELAEGPVWSAEARRLWFVDIRGRRVHCYDPADGNRQSWNAPDAVGFVLPATDGALVCGLRDGLHRFDPAAGTFRRLVEVEPDRPQNRLNDGFVAPDGSVWFGSMDDSEATCSGALYSWRDHILERHDDGYGVTNGPALSPCGSVLYHNDTLARRVYAFDHKDGVLTNRRLFAEVLDGYPDGLAVMRRASSTSDCSGAGAWAVSFRRARACPIWTCRFRPSRRSLSEATTCAISIARRPGLAVRRRAIHSPGWGGCSACAWRPPA